MRSYARIKAAVYSLLATTSKAGRKKGITSGKTQIIYKGIKYLEEDPLQEKSIAEIAQMCNIGTNYFERLFKEYSGYSPTNYRLLKKIEKAKEFFADKDDSITIMIENMLCLDSSVILEEIDAVNDKRLKVCLDIGHAHGNGDMSVYDWIKTLNKRIGYMHMHNNHGKTNIVHNDEHNGFFDGTIDMKKIMRLVHKYCPKAILSIETGYKDAEEAILFLKKYAK